MNTDSNSDFESIKRDGQSSVGKTPRERMEMFADLLETVDAIWKHLTPEERIRRMRIADKLNQRPDPWWKNMRTTELKELE
jgi:hypothetical protein